MFVLLGILAPFVAEETRASLARAPKGRREERSMVKAAKHVLLCRCSSKGRVYVGVNDRGVTNCGDEKGGHFPGRSPRGEEHTDVSAVISTKFSLTERGEHALALCKLGDHAGGQWPL